MAMRQPRDEILLAKTWKDLQHHRGQIPRNLNIYGGDFESQHRNIIITWCFHQYVLVFDMAQISISGRQSFSVLRGRKERGGWDGMGYTLTTSAKTGARLSMDMGRMINQVSQQA
eukprot:scaffold12721_cov298-Ochromonas_danica.AAC.1